MMCLKINPSHSVVYRKRFIDPNHNINKEFKTLMCKSCKTAWAAFEYNIIDDRKHCPQCNAPYVAFLGERNPGDLSKTSQGRIGNAVKWLYLGSEVKHSWSKNHQKQMPYKVGFITLLLPSKQQHTDAFFNKNILPPLLRWLQRRGCHNYVWKAEVQGNDNLHYHITVDKFIAWRELRTKWIEILDTFGYIDPFQKKHGHRNPNCTDISAVLNEKAMIKYLAKYVSKRANAKPLQDGAIYYPRRPIFARVWGCSESLSNLNITITDEEETFNECVTSLINGTGAKLLHFDYFDIIYHNLLSSIPLHNHILPLFKHLIKTLQCTK